ncbi:hypothetical protein D3C80_1248170 [compost metagenome]
MTARPGPGPWAARCRGWCRHARQRQALHPPASRRGAWCPGRVPPHRPSCPRASGAAAPRTGLRCRPGANRPKARRAHRSRQTTASSAGWPGAGVAARQRTGSGCCAPGPGSPGPGRAGCRCVRAARWRCVGQPGAFPGSGRPAVVPGSLLPPPCAIPRPAPAATGATVRRYPGRRRSPPGPRASGACPGTAGTGWGA